MEKPAIPQTKPYVIPTEAGAYWWCSCGRSANQPFCDGAHKGTGHAPVKVEITEAGTKAWCGCKNSGNGAFCDGSHSRLTG